jgi:hypothetical protein
MGALGSAYVSSLKKERKKKKKKKEKRAKVRGCVALRPAPNNHNFIVPLLDTLVYNYPMTVFLSNLS